MTTNILIVEDHVRMREALKRLLNEEQEFMVVGEAGDGLEGIRLACELKPDVIIMDISMPGLNGIEATRRLIGKIPGAKVLVYTGYLDRKLVKHAFLAGAMGYVIKLDRVNELMQGIRTVVEGKIFLSPGVGAAV